MSFSPRNKGLSLIELIVALAAGAILILVAGVLLLGSNQAYQQVYNSLHDSIIEDSRVLTMVFGTIGRQSNRSDYSVYTVRSGHFIESTPPSGESIASGQAVEFHYWDESFTDLYDGTDGMDTNDTGTHYTLFYLSGDELYADYGRIVNGIGGVYEGGHNESGLLRRVLLASHVDTSENDELFSHELSGGTGNGCVNMNVTLTNDEGESIEVKTATLLRVTWPN